MRILCTETTKPTKYPSKNKSRNTFDYAHTNTQIHTFSTDYAIQNDSDRILQFNPWTWIRIVEMYTGFSWAIYFCCIVSLFESKSKWHCLSLRLRYSRNLITLPNGTSMLFCLAGWADWLEHTVIFAMNSPQITSFVRIQSCFSIEMRFDQNVLSFFF